MIQERAKNERLQRILESSAFTERLGLLLGPLLKSLGFTVELQNEKYTLHKAQAENRGKSQGNVICRSQQNVLTLSRQVPRRLFLV
jgi:hypothetical protein